MKVELINAIDEEFEMCPEAFGGPVNIEEVTQAEDELKVKLPEDFKMFLTRYGSGAVGEAIVLGLKEAEFVATPSFVKQTFKFRESLPKNYEKFVVIGIDGAGNPIGFNSPNTEIIRFDHDTFEAEVIAINFEKYLEKALIEEINIHF
ncbi:SMI1/KNR4 family protein [Solibacillus ferritrahens]|uniref:SMI1/KNR4 family protein n=1 Tax=Solibacillus ferritrahens TaxID=3098620 RepID=UPI00300BAD85